MLQSIPKIRLATAKCSTVSVCVLGRESLRSLETSKFPEGSPVMKDLELVDLHPFPCRWQVMPQEKRKNQLGILKLAKAPSVEEGRAQRNRPS